MKRLKNFFQEIYLSCCSFSFYEKLPKRKYTSGLTYFLGLITVISLLLTAFEGIVIIRIANDAIDAFTKTTPDFQITVTDGKLSSDLKQPYTLSNFLVLDTTGQVTSLASRPESVLITVDGMQVKQSEFETREYTFKDTKNARWTKQMSLDFIQQFGGMTKGIFIVILFAILWLGFAIGYLLYTLFFAFFGWLFMRNNSTFKSILITSYHALTAALIVSVILNMFTMPIKFLFTAIFLVYFVNALRQMKKG